MKPIICSLSTIPGRIHSLLSVLQSIPNSSILPQRVVISICREYPRLRKEYSQEDLSKLISFLETYSIPTTIARYDIDPGPILKLQSPLMLIRENGPIDSLILTMDDDTFLYEKGIERMLSSHQKFPDSTLCLMGVRNGVFIHGEDLSNELEVDIMGGYRSALYPAKIMLEKGMLNWIGHFVQKHRSSGIPLMHDDHIFSSFHKKHEISMMVVPIPNTNQYAENTKEIINYTYIVNEDGIFDDESTSISMNKTKDIIQEMLEEGDT